MAFLPDTQATPETSDKLSVSEYIAIGICSILLGLIYVASIFLYINLRKRNKDASPKSDNHSMNEAEEGVIKSNPLLSINSPFKPADVTYSDSSSSDTDITPDVIPNHDNRKKTVS